MVASWRFHICIALSPVHTRSFCQWVPEEGPNVGKWLISMRHSFAGSSRMASACRLVEYGYQQYNEWSRRSIERRSACRASVWPLPRHTNPPCAPEPHCGQENTPSVCVGLNSRISLIGSCNVSPLGSPCLLVLTLSDVQQISLHSRNFA